MSSLIRFARLGRPLLNSTNASKKKCQKRMSSEGINLEKYRDQEYKLPDWVYRGSEAGMAITIFWMGSMLYKHFDHVVGEYPAIHPETWTDEELGIPPDDEDVYPPGYIPLAQRPKPEAPPRKECALLRIKENHETGF